MPSAYDAVVVGAGPAGLSAAAEIVAQGGRCLVVEQGPKHTARDRTADVLSGVGGAGLFSDGKHSFFPAATALWELPHRDALDRAFARTRDLLARHGVVAPDRGTVANAVVGEWHLKRYPSIYASLAERMRCIEDLFEQCGELPWLSARVVAARREGDLVVLEVDQGGERREIEARAVVVATGRLSPRWIRGWLEPLGAVFAFRRLEIGVRIETDAASPLFGALTGVDPKLTLDLGDGTRVLTFCTCRDGEVVRGIACNIHAVSGRADGPRTGRSSIGVLARITDERLAREIEPFVFGGAPPFAAPLHDAPLASTFGERGGAIVARALDAFIARFPPGDSATVHGPCIEGVGDYPTSDDRLAVAPGVFVAGDACGRFRGIVASMVSGRYAGEMLVTAWR